MVRNVGSYQQLVGITAPVSATWSRNTMARTDGQKGSESKEEGEEETGIERKLIYPDLNSRF
jgi:hypothetical protein